MDDRWTIGELAAAAGVTTRTIRHYEAEGLLASERTGTGHRRFDARAAHALYQAVALRRLGLAIPEIRTVLAADDQDAALQSTARRQLAAVDEQVRAAGALRERLAALVDTRPPIPSLALEATAMTIALDQITTRTGDDGTTSVVGPGRLRKDDARIEALGAVDEVNAQLGLTACHPEADVDHRPHLVEAQQRLFDIGGDLAAGRSGVGSATDADVERVEALVTRLAAGQPPLTTFVLPGGGPYAAQLHAARTACRTAERRVVALDDAPDDALRYLNRLSDLLFVLARDAATEDVLWEPRT